jgi:hypothetical protein
MLRLGAAASGVSMPRPGTGFACSGERVNDFVVERLCDATTREPVTQRNGESG